MSAKKAKLAKPATFVHVAPPANPKANFIGALDALASAVSAASGKLVQAFRAACHYSPKAEDFEGKNADSVKSQKSFIMSVSKTADVIGPDAAHAMLDAALKLSGRMRENVTGVSRQVRALVKIAIEFSGKDKATPQEVKRCIETACRDQDAANKAAQADKAAKAASGSKPAKASDKAEPDALAGKSPLEVVKVQLQNVIAACGKATEGASKAHAVELALIASSASANLAKVTAMMAEPQPAKLVKPAKK